MVSDINVEFAARLLDEIRIHTNEMGGVFVSLCGSKGSGKTTWMHQYATQVGYIHPATKALTKETVIWRGRDIDYWNWWLDPTYEWENTALKRDVVIHIHSEDEVEFRDEMKRPVTVPHLRKYFSAPELYSNLETGAINVVYEPRDYRMSPAVKDILAARCCTVPLSGNIRLDPPIFWFEFLAFLLRVKGPGFISILLDEADEIFPQNPVGIRWHIQEWFKDNAKDMRKNNITCLFSCHDWNDVDYRIGSKVQYKIWMKGARLPNSSIIRQLDANALTRMLFTAVGQAMIERDGYGTFNIPKLRERPRVKAHFLNLAGRDYERWVPTYDEERDRLKAKALEKAKSQPALTKSGKRRGRPPKIRDDLPGTPGVIR